MRGFGSIERAHGVDEPDYEPPARAERMVETGDRLQSAASRMASFGGSLVRLGCSGSVLLAIVLIVAGAFSSHSANSSPPESITTSAEEQTTTAASTPAPAKTVASKLQATTSCGNEGQTDFGVSVNANTSCPFAMAVLKAYVQAGWAPSTPKAATVSAWSPTTHKSYSMSCAALSSEAIGCSGANHAYLTFQIAVGSAIASQELEAQRSSEGGDQVGSLSHATDEQFCEEHECIGSFTSEEGTVVECADGTYSHAGGISGACSDHGGEREG